MHKETSLDITSLCSHCPISFTLAAKHICTNCPCLLTSVYSLAHLRFGIDLDSSVRTAHPVHLKITCNLYVDESSGFYILILLQQDINIMGHFFLCESSFTFCDSTYSYGCSFCSSFSRQPLIDRILRLGPESTFFLYTLPLVHLLMPLPFSTSVCEWMPQFLSPM